MIQSVYIGDDAELVPALLDLHRAGPIVLDSTWGHGGFWRDVTSSREVDRLIVGIDRRMNTDELTLGGPSGERAALLMEGDYTDLPFRDDVFDAIVYDPPFLTRGGDDSVMKARYGSFDTYADLMESIALARDEFQRVLTHKAVNDRPISEVPNATRPSRAPALFAGRSAKAIPTPTTAARLRVGGPPRPRFLPRKSFRPPAYRFSGSC